MPRLWSGDLWRHAANLWLAYEVVGPRGSSQGRTCETLVWSCLFSWVAVVVLALTQGRSAVASQLFTERMPPVSACSWRRSVVLATAVMISQRVRSGARKG